MSKRNDHRKSGDKPRAPGRQAGLAGGKAGGAAGERVLIYGFHAALAALENQNRRLLGVFATQAAAERLQSVLHARRIEPRIVTNEGLAARLGEQAVHQGLLVEAAPLPAPAVEDLFPASPLIVLDQVTDPQNVGAILRSAAAFSAGAVIVQDRNAPQPAGALAKAATGALEHVAYVQVTNIARTLDQLKRDGYWVVGLDGDGAAGLDTVFADRRPVVLVLGAEGTGMRRLTAEACDSVARLDLPGPIKTLNVSNAAAIALYAATKGNL